MFIIFANSKIPSMYDSFKKYLGANGGPGTIWGVYFFYSETGATGGFCIKEGPALT